MKNFSEISDRELEYFKSHPVYVEEMLDMVSFKMVVKGNTYSIFSPKGRAITKLDMVVNSVYSDIDKFCYTVLNAAMGTVGDCTIRFFYLPAKKTKSITYYNAVEGTYFLSDIYVNDKTRVCDKDKLIKDLPRIVITDNLVELKDGLPKNVNRETPTEQLIEDIVGSWSASRNLPKDVEGYILSCGKEKYKVVVNITTPSIDSAQKLLCRDTIIEDFISRVSDELVDEVIRTKRTYVSRVESLFLEYINSTDISSTLYIDEEDVEPPIVGYVGDIDYSVFTDTTHLICSSNPFYKNILRMLLITFSASPFDNKFKRFSDTKRERLTKFLVKLQSI